MNLFAKKHNASGRPDRMSVNELTARFPEIPEDIRQETLLSEFAEVLADFLRVAESPSACTTDYSREHRYYLKLIGPMKIFMYGLASREKTLAQLQKLLDKYRENPDTFGRYLEENSPAA